MTRRLYGVVVGFLAAACGAQAPAEGESDFFRHFSLREAVAHLPNQPFDPPIHARSARSAETTAGVTIWTRAFTLRAAPRPDFSLGDDAMLLDALDRQVRQRISVAGLVISGGEVVEGERLIRYRKDNRSGTVKIIMAHLAAEQLAVWCLITEVTGPRRGGSG